MEIKNKNIELSKYFNITTISENNQEQRIGYFASIPRLLEVLCTIPLSRLKLTANFNVTSTTPIVKNNEIYHKSDTQEIVDNYSETNSEHTVEIGTIVNTSLTWFWKKEIYKTLTTNEGLDKNKVVLTDLKTRIPTKTTLKVEGISLTLPTNATTLPLDNTNITNNLGIIKSNIVTDVIITRTISAPILNAPLIEKSDENEYLRYGEGNINRSVKVKLKFRAYTYCGALTSRPTIFTAANITGLTKVQTEDVKSNWSENKNRIVNNVDLADDQYLIYAYPKYMGELNDIIVDGGVSAINSFKANDFPKTVKLSNEIDYYVYCSALPGCLNGSRIEFK